MGEERARTPSERQARFDQLFADDPDPWDIDTSDYERGKREAVLAALGERRFERLLEVGCAGGALTERLVERANSIVALDVSTKALELSSRRLHRFECVEFVAAEVPSYWPDGQFDAVILSEVLYFLSAGEIRQVSLLAHQSLTGNGLCLLVNWTGSNDLPVDGDRAAELFLDAAPWRVAKARREQCYRLDLLERGAGD
ncbi:MAG: nodulation S family protein [Alphaproteobacteria bacterium]|nr:nodulation S family protein [Alphaproteobacteria bacterium]